MLRVLVVDDCPDSAFSLAALTSLWGFETRVAVGGGQALEEAESFPPDAILLDIAMPGVDGFEVARRVRALPGCGEVLLVATTGCDGRGERPRAVALGFAHFLIKPIDLGRLKQILDGQAKALDTPAPFPGPALREQPTACARR